LVGFASQNTSVQQIALLALLTARLSARLIQPCLVATLQENTLKL
jgi:hypothetical protein